MLPPKTYRRNLKSIAKFFKVTGFLVLVTIVLHPSVLIVQRYRDGYGLLPSSYESYVAPAKAWITLFGSVRLLIFLAYALKRFFVRYSWWRYVLILNDVAIVAIFYHGLRSSTQLNAGWFHFVWYFYDITLVAALGYKYNLKFRHFRAKR